MGMVTGNKEYTNDGVNYTQKNPSSYRTISDVYFRPLLASG